MTLEEFFTELKSIAPQFHWYFSPEGALRAYDPDKLGAFCPLTAVHYARKGAYLHTSYATAIALEYGLTKVEAWAVQHAADNTPVALQWDVERLLAATGVFI